MVAGSTRSFNSIPARLAMMPLPYRVIVVQTFVAGLIAATLLLLNATDAWAALLAGIAVVIPNAYFAWRVVGLDPADDPERASRRLVAQGVQKLLLMVLVMALVFAMLAPEPLAFFGTLIVLQGVHWLAPLMAGPPRRAARQRD